MDLSSGHTLFNDRRVVERKKARDSKYDGSASSVRLFHFFVTEVHPFLLAQKTTSSRIFKVEQRISFIPYHRPPISSPPTPKIPRMPRILLFPQESFHRQILVLISGLPSLIAVVNLGTILIRVVRVIDLP